MGSGESPASPADEGAPASPDAPEIPLEEIEEAPSPEISVPNSNMREFEQGEIEDDEITSDLPKDPQDIDMREPIAFVMEDEPKRNYGTSEWTEKYKHVGAVQEAFNKLVSLGDLNSIYRNRPIWCAYPASDLVEPCTKILETIPTSRGAVIHFCGLLIHETTHCFFTAKENPQFAVDFSSVQSAAMMLIKTVEDFIVNDGAVDKDAAIEILNWSCTLSSELSLHNSGRPCAVNGYARGPENLMMLFKTCPTINQLISLVDTTVRALLADYPDKCMNVLFDSFRHGHHFAWIWLHIALTFPSLVVDNLFKVGARQFKEYALDIHNKLKNKVTPAIVISVHEDFRAKFGTLSEVFNLLNSRGNPELRLVVAEMLKESLEEDPAKTLENSNINIAFFFKLVTLSVQTLRSIITQNSKLVTPLNFYRGMRQVISIDKNCILHNKSFIDFGHQAMTLLDSKSQGIVFKVVMQLAFDVHILTGFDHQEPGICRQVKDAALTAADEMVNILLNIVHRNQFVNGTDFPAIDCFSTGVHLQFLIESALNNPLWTPVIIRYFHCLSIVYGEAKASEIAARLIISCNDENRLIVLCAFLRAVCPFIPSVMTAAYKNLFSIRSIMKDESHDGPNDTRLLTNIINLFSWDLNMEDSHIMKCCRLNPGGTLGHLLTGLLGIADERCSLALDNDDFSVVLSTCRLISQLLLVLAPVVKTDNSLFQSRSVYLQNRHSYKLAIQLASLLSCALLSVSQASDSSLTSLDELCASICSFYQNYCNPAANGYSRLFFLSFVMHCFINNNKFFGETVCLDPWKPYESSARNQEEDCYSFLDNLDSLTINSSLASLAHSGRLGNSRRNANLKRNNGAKLQDDQILRRHAFVGTVQKICTRYSLEWNLTHSKVLATTLTEVICQDALSADFLFSDYDLEKDSLSRYLEVSQRLSGSWVCEALLTLLAEQPPCLWFCLPILKALLVQCMNKFEAAVDKFSKPYDVHLELFDKFLFLTRASDILPARYDFYMDILPEVTLHEGFLMLLEIWRLFQQRAITFTTVDTTLDMAIQNKDNTNLMKDNWEGDFTPVHNVMQKNIVKLAHLYPLIFPKEVQALSKS